MRKKERKLCKFALGKEIFGSLFVLENLPSNSDKNTKVKKSPQSIIAQNVDLGAVGLPPLRRGSLPRPPRGCRTRAESSTRTRESYQGSTTQVRGKHIMFSQTAFFDLHMSSDSVPPRFRPPPGLSLPPPGFGEPGRRPPPSPHRPGGRPRRPPLP